MNRPIAAAAVALLLAVGLPGALAAMADAPGDPPAGAPGSGPDVATMNAAQAAEGAVGIEIPADPDEGFTVTDHEGYRIPEAMLMDPPRDAARPARNRQLLIPSGPVRPELGRPAEMNALFFLAAGEGPKPTMLLLHGLPGNERNLDLAQAVRRAGWNVLTFTYRGAWGSEGTFSIQHAMADAQAALAFLRRPDAAARYDVDPARIVVAGHSMGGMAAAWTAANDPPGDPPLAGLVLIDAWNVAATAREAKAAGEAGRAAFVAEFDDVGHSLGIITAADLADNVIRRGEEWDLAALAPKLARTPILTVYAKHGIAAENEAIAAALRAQPRARVVAMEMDTDHSFADHRIALAASVINWLKGIDDGP